MGCLKLTYQERQGLEKSVIFLGGSLRKKVQSGKKCDDYYPFGMVMAGTAYDDESRPAQLYKFNGNEVLEGNGIPSTLNLMNFNARLYNPALGVFLAVDPQNQFSNPYLAFGNNPTNTIDPDGEFAWFIPIIVGAVIGGTSQGIQSVKNGGNFWDGAWKGALVGAAAGATGFGLSALGGGAMLVGAGAGAIGGAGFTGIATNWDGRSMLRGGLIGAAAGLVGGGVASAVGGGGGAFLGGASSDITGQLLSTGNVDFGRAGLAGAMGFGMYHAMSYASYKFGGGDVEIAGRKLSYEQFNKINVAYQKSRFWKKEHGVYLNNDGSARFVPRNDRHKFDVTFDDWQKGDFGTCHSHWAKPGVEYANIGGTGKWRRYNPNYKYPQSTLIRKFIVSDS